MKELERKLNNLTNPAQTPYSKGGDIFMAEQGEGRRNMPQPKSPNPPNPERIENVVPQKPQKPDKPILQERTAQINRSWDDWTEKYLREQGRPKLTFEERQTVETAKRAGRMPHPVAGGQDESEAARRGERVGDGEARQAGQQPEIKTGPATWKSKDADQPINVTGYFGRGADGREYVSVEGSSTGVPLDEIEFPTPVTEAGAGVPPGGEPPRAPPITPPEEPDNQGENHSPEGEQPSVTDRTAANLISKFRQEHGENDPAKIQQLRIDLSGRIQQLERERDELGAREGSTTPEGELTPAAAQAINEIDNRIRELQGFIADVFPSPERTGRGERPLRPEEILVNETDEYVKGLLARGLKRSQINDLSLLTETEKATRAKLVHDIKKFIEDQPSIETGHFPSDILLAVRNFKELREELISEILFKSFTDKSETNEYEVGLYAASNLDILLGFLSKDDNERYKELFTLRTAARFFQTMNATIIKGTFDSFGHSAENINYQHFEKMRDIRGSGLAMRLFEQGYKDLLAEDKRVLQDRIDGLKDKVAKEFREINEAGEIRSEFADFRGDSKMEEWEVERALNVGRTFLNVTLRAAESIATGQVPSDRRRYTSPPQEDMVRILNWNQWLLGRFAVGGEETGRHGVEFLKMSTDRWEEFLRYKGAKLNINKIAEFGGVDVRKMEEGGQYRTSGVYSGWRMENAAFDDIYFDYQGGRISVQEFRDRPDIKPEISKITDRIKEKQKAHPDMEPKDLVTKKDQEEYRDILMPAVDNLKFGLSSLIKNGDFGKQDDKLGYFLRIEIWKKIANTNIPLMVNYLTGIKYEWSKLGEIDKKLVDLGLKTDKSKQDRLEEWKLREEKSRLEKIKDEAERAGLQEAKPLELLKEEIFGRKMTDKEWKDFRSKILIRHERMIREGMLEKGEKLEPLDSRYELSVEERRLEEAIKEEGTKLAPQLADIVFSYMPFMNDMPFEKFNYAKLGQTFYKRRSTNDLGGFNKGQQAYAKIMTNPGGIPVKEAVTAMGEIIAGVESPEGPRPAIEANFPTFSALLDVVTTDPGKRQAIFKMLLEATRSETSIAQRWAGIKADSFIESEAANLIDDTLRQGILTPDLARYLKKEKHLTLPFILWMLFRDVFLITVPVSIATELFGAVKGK